MIVFLNWKGPQGRETVDQFNCKDWPSYTAAKRELRRILDEYALCGMGGIYTSSRCCSNWKD